ncbi:hypothetical protein OROMI_030701 [Orobanche minor]
MCRHLLQWEALKDSSKLHFKKQPESVRCHFHDDISVIVLFLNHEPISKGSVQNPPLSIRSALE